MRLNTSGDLHVIGQCGIAKHSNVPALFGSASLPCNAEKSTFVLSVGGDGDIQWAMNEVTTQLHMLQRRAKDMATGEVYETERYRSLIRVTKWSPEGSLLWRKVWSGNAGDNGGTAIVVGTAGDIFVAGYFSGTVAFKNQTLQAPPGIAGINAFIAKIDSTGEPVWACQIGGPHARSMGYGVATDSFGHAYVTGWFEGKIQVGLKSLPSTGNRDAFVAKIEPDGEIRWVQRAGGVGADSGASIVVNEAGGIFVTGSFTGPASFGTQDLVSSGDLDIFWMKLVEDGAEQVVSIA